MRAAALASAALLAGMAGVVAARVGIALPRWRRAARRLIWAVVAYAVVGVALNAVTPSPRERAVWLPVAVVLAVCALVVARSTPSDA
jgi:predicted membrane channel-forming protein YqfA (hemolysin III family)